MSEAVKVLVDKLIQDDDFVRQFEERRREDYVTGQEKKGDLADMLMRLDEALDKIDSEQRVARFCLERILEQGLAQIVINSSEAS
jgi:hypothetical protein